MDTLQIYSQMFSVLWFFIPLAIFAAIIKSPWFKGIAGEFLVSFSLKHFLDKKQYHLINNVTMPTEDGTTQIDHIVVSRFGVFVIETKNMKGWIFGAENQKQWTQQIFKHKSQFQNPLHQNYKHTKTLESSLRINPGNLFSVVVFVGDSTFKTPMPENVTSIRGCLRFIKSKTAELLSAEKMQLIIEAIEEGRLVRSYKTNSDHINHVEDIMKAKGKSDSIGNSSKNGKGGKAIVPALAGVLVAIIFVVLMGLVVVNMFNDFANNSIAKSQEIHKQEQERIRLQQEKAIAASKRVIQQKPQVQITTQQPLINVELERQKREAQLAYEFEKQFIPTPECVNPSEAVFVQCVNYRRRARLHFLEVHKLD
jgi:restriction system protein